MRHAELIYALLLMFPGLGGGAQEDVFESTDAVEDVAPSTDPGSPFWRSTPAVHAERGSDGAAMPRYRTEIRSRWTKRNLYFSHLFNGPVILAGGYNPEIAASAINLEPRASSGVGIGAASAEPDGFWPRIRAE